MRAFAFGFAAWTALSVTAGNALAEARQDARRSAPSTVVVFTGTGPQVSEVSRLFVAIVQASRGDVQVVQAAGAENAAIVVELDARPGTSWRLRLTKGQRVLHRELGAGVEQDAAIVEAAALSAAQATLALLEAPEAELPEWTSSAEPVTAESSESPPLAAPPPRETPSVKPEAASGRWFAAGHYELSLLASDVFDSGVGLSGGFEWASGVWLSGAATHAPWLELESDAGRFALVRTRAGLAVGFRSQGSLFWGAGLGGFVESRTRPRGVPSERVAATPGKTSWHLGITPQLRVGGRLGAHVELALVASVAGTARTRYATPTQTLLELYPVRPSLALELSYHFGELSQPNPAP